LKPRKRKKKIDKVRGKKGIVGTGTTKMRMSTLMKGLLNCF